MAVGDLLQEGRLALLEAFSRYNPTSQETLFSYAMKWVESGIKQFIMNFAGPSRPTTDGDRRAFFRGEWKVEIAELTTNIPAADRTPEDLVIEADEERHRGSLVQALLNGLSDRERDLVRRRILSDHPETLSSIARQAGVSFQTIHAIETRALDKMRRALPHDVISGRVAWAA